VVAGVYDLGDQRLHEHRREEIDPADQRQVSVFQLGWRLRRRLISCGTPPACTLQLQPFRPNPVWYGTW